MTTRNYKQAFIAWAAFLELASFQPFRPVFRLVRVRLVTLHDLVHVSCFGVLAFLAIRAFPGRRSLGWSVPVCLLFGFAIEVSQHLVNGRRVEWLDVSNDSIGVAIALLVRLLQPERRVAESKAREGETAVRP